MLFIHVFSVFLGIFILRDVSVKVYIIWNLISFYVYVSKFVGILVLCKICGHFFKVYSLLQYSWLCVFFKDADMNFWSTWNTELKEADEFSVSLLV